MGKRTLYVDGFHGGVNFRDAPLDLDSPDLADAVDLVPYGDDGAVTTREADATLADLTAHGASLIKLLHYAAPVSPGVECIVAMTSTGKVVSFAMDGSGVTVRHSPAYAPPFADNGDRFAFVVAAASGGEGPLYGVVPDTSPSTPTPVQWDGNAASFSAWTASAGAIPLVGRFVYAGNRVWGAGPWLGVGTAVDSSVYWSELGDPRNWPVANTLQLAPGDGEAIVALADYGPYVIVFKESKAWAIYDLDTGANRPLGEDVGALNQDTTIATPYGLVFIDPSRGPMLTDGSSVKPLPNGTKIGKLNWSTFTDVVYLDDHLYFLGGWSGAAVFDYDMRRESWWPLGYEAATLAASTDTLYAGRGGVAHVDTLKVDTLMARVGVGGQPLEPQLTLPSMRMGALYRRKRITGIDVFAEGDAVLDDAVFIYQALDGMLMNFVAPLPVVLGPGGERHLALSGVCNSYQLKISSLGRFTLSAVAVDYLLRAR